MADIVDKATRSRMMSGIRSKNTKPELIIRKALFKKGFRYKLHDKTMPGKPDMVLPKYNSVIFMHGHDCHLFKWPSTRPEFWKKKINRNVEVDERNYAELKSQGWYILTIWECAIKGKTRLKFENVVTDIEEWLVSGKINKTIKGK